MISIPENYQNNPSCDRKFLDLIKMFNKLETDLQYPYCEGNAEAVAILRRFQNALILRGVL